MFQVKPRRHAGCAQPLGVDPLLSGICGGDLSELLLHTDMRVYPLGIPGQGSGRCFLGHEVVGDVIEIGLAVSRFPVGDRVVYEGSARCRTQARRSKAIIQILSRKPRGTAAMDRPHHPAHPLP